MGETPLSYFMRKLTFLYDGSTYQPSSWTWPNNGLVCVHRTGRGGGGGGGGQGGGGKKTDREPCEIHSLFSYAPSSSSSMGQCGQKDGGDPKVSSVLILASLTRSPCAPPLYRPPFMVDNVTSSACPAYFGTARELFNSHNLGLSIHQIGM